MPKVSRRRVIGAPPREVWSLVSDPYSLPRWWPRTVRVENVELTKAGRRSRWTQVLQTSAGRGVRADFRCSGSTEESRYAWEQEIAGSPFEKHLKSSEIEIALEPSESGSTSIRITSRQSLRGLSRLGALLMTRGQGAIVSGALDGIEAALAPIEEDPVG